MKDFFKDKKVLITGGTGSLGQALRGRLLSLGARPIVYSRDEGKQALLFGSIDCIIGDVRDYEKIDVCLQRLRPDYIIHAAALKRIDDMEFCPDECVKTNITGSTNVARASLSNEIEKCILISTDKACQPVNVYGSSKFIAERVFTNYDYYSKSTVFSSVRYGNVIASRGSFIPLWIDLIKKGSPLKITSMECTRFLFTLDNAVDAVLHSLMNSIGGEVFVPEIDSFTMSSVIKAVHDICGVDPIDHQVIGMRPGEKLHEDMLAKTELPHTHKMPTQNLLQIRPQYTKKIYQNWPSYEGSEFNSSLHINSNVDELKALILKGLS